MKTPNLYLLSLCLAGGLFAASAGSDSSSITTPFLSTGVDADAKGTVLATLNPRKSSLRLNAANLLPSATYALVADGNVQQTINTDAKGSLRLTLSNPAKTGTSKLQFDPRGNTLELQHDGTAVLRVTVSGAGEPVGARVTERALLSPEAGTAARAGLVTYTLSKKGDRKFTVTFPVASGTNYALYVDGVPQGSIPVKGRTARATFTNNPRKAADLPLNFDPRGKVLDLVQSQTVAYTGECQARGRGVNYDIPEVISGFVPSTGADPDATAKGKYRLHPDARETFSLELEDVPEAAYELLVNGEAKGTIIVTARDNGTEGEVEFATRSDDADKLPLDFDPLTASYEVRAGAVVFFQGGLDTTPPVIQPGNDPIHIEEYLTSTGLIPSASAEAEFEISASEREFKVKLEDVAVGRYDVWVGETKRGHMHVDAESDGRGEVKWSAGDDNDDLPLDFEPRGELIEISSSTGIIFSHIFGSGSSGGGTGTGTTVPYSVELPLFNAGVAPGKAKFEYEQEDDGERSFEVEIENAPVGTYSVQINGVAQGTITVTPRETGTYGKIQFEDDDSLDPGKLPLGFDPLGQTIELERDGAIYFGREIPGLN